jgi:dihydroneopterin aldolase
METTMAFPHLVGADQRILDQVQLTGMLMSCVIGIFPAERSRKQPVTIDMCLYLDTRRAARSTNINDTIDYAGAVKEISFILEHCEFQLIETAVEAICRHFLLTYQADHSLPTIDAVMVRISKPSALTHGIVPSVQIMRHRADYHAEQLNSKTDKGYMIHSAQDSRIHLLVASDHEPINIRDHVDSPNSLLPIGKWSFNNQPVKSRVPITLTHDEPCIFSHMPSITSTGPKLLLIQSYPQIPQDVRS